MDARRMADGSSIVHSYYYHKHDTWLQIYSKLWRVMDGQGSLVECSYNHLDSLSRCRMEHVATFQHAESWQMCWTFQNSQRIPRYMQNFAGRCRMHLKLSQITTEIFPTFISVDNREHKSAQCDWALLIDIELIMVKTWLY